MKNLTPSEAERQIEAQAELIHACRKILWAGWHGKRKPETNLTVLAQEVLAKITAPDFKATLPILQFNPQQPRS